MNRLETMRAWFRQFMEDLRTTNNDKATGILEYEIQQMETIFCLIIFGSFIGMPAPPAYLTLELMPLMEREAVLLFDSVCTARNALGELSEILGEP